MKLRNDQIRHLTENEKSLLYKLVHDEYQTARLDIEPQWLKIDRVVSIIENRMGDMTGPGKRVAKNIIKKINDAS